MATHVFLKYYINWPNAEQLTESGGGPGFGAVNGAAPGNTPIWGVAMSPDQATLTYSAPQLDAGPAPFVSPSIMSEWFTTEFNYPRDVYQFTRKSGGWFGIHLLFGKTTNFTWFGIFQFAPAPNDSQIPGEVITAIPQRIWMDGMELVDEGERGSGGMGNHCSRAASRTVEGFGLNVDNITNTRSHSRSEADGVNSPSTAERFYLRILRYPTASMRVWRNNGATNTLSGVSVDILPTGQIAVYTIDGGGASTLLGTFATVPLGVWQKVDMIYRFNLTTGFFQLALKGQRICHFLAGSMPGGIGATQNHGNSNIGSGSASTGLFHVDDWIGFVHPAYGSTVGQFGPAASNSVPDIAWNSGSHVKRIMPTGFAATHSGNWTGGLWTARHFPTNTLVPTAAMSCIVASSRAAFTTDADLVIDADHRVMGIAGLIVNVFGTRGTNSGQVGYKLPGGAEVLMGINQAVGASWGGTIAPTPLYRPSGLIAPLTPLAGLEISYVKGADVVAATIALIAAAAECIGIFGPEDVVIQPGAADDSEPTTDAFFSKHNATYPRTVWARPGPRPPTPVALMTGTYTGNGTSQDITFRNPVSFLFFRQDVAATSWAIWWPALMGAHLTGGLATHPNIVHEALVQSANPLAENDQELRCIIRIAGAAGTININATAFRYFAFMDPGMRFSMGGGFPGYVQPSVDQVELFPDENFTPQAVLFQRESATTSGTMSFGVKGPGHAVGNLNLSGAAEGTGLSMATGRITHLAAGSTTFANAFSAQIGYLALRKNDGSSDAQAGGVVQITSWTGDGSASRTISLGATSGFRPLFAIVMGHGGVTLTRDPGHLTNTSLQLPNTNVTTGITAGGIDSITVGLLGNANAVVYEAIVFMGSATAGNGGWSVDGEFNPIDPNPEDPGRGAFDDDPSPVEIPDDEDDDVVEPGGDDTDFGTQCVAASTKCINQALSRIGVSKRVDDIVAEQSEEAAVARLHYSDELSQVLRDFDWAFATRYVDLVLIDGSETDPVNGDWTYAYRAPINMMKARRIVNPDGSKRAYDLNPPTFRVGSDSASAWNTLTNYAAGARVESAGSFYVALRATLGDTPATSPSDWELSTSLIIYTNQVDPELEYTVRPECAAASGDALFKDCFVWKLAAALAPVLSRDKGKQQFCLGMYQQTLPQAKNVNAQEAQQEKPGESDWITGRE